MQTWTVLVINPNGSSSITQLIRTRIDLCKPAEFICTYWTCTGGPEVLRNQEDINRSTRTCFDQLHDLVDKYDAFLLACYADHPLTTLLQSMVGSKPVQGIFEGSIQSALRVMPSGKRFAILTTGQSFEKQLDGGVLRMIGPSKKAAYFAGAVATGIGPEDVVAEEAEKAGTKIRQGLQRILGMKDVAVVCIGGVILAGLEHCMKDACKSILGAAAGEEIIFIDQFAAGLAEIERELA